MGPEFIGISYGGHQQSSVPIFFHHVFRVRHDVISSYMESCESDTIASWEGEVDADIGCSHEQPAARSEPSPFFVSHQGIIPSDTLRSVKRAP